MWIIIKKLVASSFLFVSISCNNATINEVEQVPLINSKFSNAIHVNKDQANMVNYNFDSKVTIYEKFNELTYTKKDVGFDKNLEILNRDGCECIKGYWPSSNDNTMPSNILGSDDRSYVYTECKNYPCRTLGLVIATYHQVFNNNTKKYVDRIFGGTCFLVGPNIVATAGHCTFADVTDSAYFDDGRFNPRFADSIEIYFGVNGLDEYKQRSSYRWYVKAKVANIQKDFYEASNDYKRHNYDWAAIELDRNIGYELGWNGRIRNYYEKGHTIESYGYPGDKPLTMWCSVGKMIGKNDFVYYTDLDSYGGQSGSPYFIVNSFNEYYVCGIHTFGSDSYNGGTIFNDFITAYFNSYFEGTIPDGYLQLEIEGKNGNTWIINVGNWLNFDVTVQYNSKMCNFNDAKNWNGLKDVKTLNISRNQEKTIDISENWFATSIAVSYQRNGKRYITYADKLNTNKTMNLYYSSK